MRIGIVVDSACDLPSDFIAQHNIVLLPITIRVGDQTFADVRDLALTRELYAVHLGGHSKDYAETVPYTAEQIEHLFLTRLVLDFDYVVCLCVSGTRSPIFQHATQASYHILTKYRAIREKAGVPGQFRLRVFDSQNLFPGQGVQVLEVVRMLESGVPITELLFRLEQVIKQTYAYMVPSDLYYLYSRAQKKGDSSVGWMSYTMGSALDIKPVLRALHGETAPVAKVRHFEAAAKRLFENVAREIEHGLVAPFVNVSYGGDLARVLEFDGYADMAKAAAAHDVQIKLSLMSMTGGVNVGRDGLAVGIIAQPHKFQ